MSLCKRGLWRVHSGKFQRSCPDSGCPRWLSYKLSQQDRWRIWESGKSRTGTRATAGQDSPKALFKLASSPGRRREGREIVEMTGILADWDCSPSPWCRDNIRPESRSALFQTDRFRLDPQVGFKTRSDIVVWVCGQRQPAGRPTRESRSSLPEPRADDSLSAEQRPSGMLPLPFPALRTNWSQVFLPHVAVLPRFFWCWMWRGHGHWDLERL